MGDRRVASFFYGSFVDDNILKQLGVVVEGSEVAVFVLRHHTRMIAKQDGSVYSTRCSAAYAVYRGANGRDVRSIPNSSPELSWR